jgi:tetratricopeptide (TPR) repeat protein
MHKLASSLIVLFVASAADAKPKPKNKGELKAHMERAAKAHKDGNYDVALDELQAAYALDPQPKLLFAIAQVHVKLDNCDTAIDYYEKFLAAEKDKSKQSVVRQAIDACNKKLDEKSEKLEKTDGVFRQKKDGEPPKSIGVDATTETKVEVPVEPQPQPVEPPPPPPPVERPEPRPVEPPVAVVTTTESSPWYTDPIGDALVVAGVGATVGSLLMYRAAQSEVDKADNAASLELYKEHRDRAEQKQLYTVVLAGSGVALVAAGVLRFALRDGTREQRRVAIVPAAGGGLITWSGGF